MKSWGWEEDGWKETQNKYTVHVFEDLLHILEDKLELDLNWIGLLDL